MPKGSLTAKITVAAAAIVVALLLGECVVRVARLAPEVVVLELGRYRLSQNPKIGYEPVPGVTFATKVPDSVFAGKKTDDERALAELRYLNDLRVDYREGSNRLGYRDYDHATDKPPGRFRVVLLGDSIAAGLLVPEYRLTLPAALERELKAQGKDAEVVSFAVNGYNTQQEVETLVDRGLVYRPDVVVVAYCHNDRRQVDGGMLHKLVEKHASGAPASAFAGFLVAHSHLARLVWYRLGKNRPLPEAYRSLEKDTVEASLEKLAALGKEHGFSVVLAVFPNFGYDMSKETAVLAGVAQRLGFKFVDLLPYFQACGKTEGPQNIDRWHLRPAGHTCAGRALADILR